jgi:hypothetical protein
MEANADGWENPEFSGLAQVLDRLEQGINRISAHRSSILNKLIKAGADRKTLLLYMALAVVNEKLFLQGAVKGIKQRQMEMERFASRLAQMVELTEDLRDDPFPPEASSVDVLVPQLSAPENRALVEPSELATIRSLASRSKEMASWLGEALRHPVTLSLHFRGE